jgi:hypothetical protein
MTGAPIVVTCTGCDGLTFRLTECWCRDGGGAFLVDAGATAGPDRTPWPGCELCRGAGTVAQPCVDCDQHGRLRAQLVLTVANLETGAVASANVVPGVVAPTLSPHGGWRLALFPLLAELAGQTGAAVGTLREVDQPTRPIDPDGELSLHLPRAWRPELPDAERHALETAALAGHSRHPWWIYLGASTDPDPPDHKALLTQLCRAADQLCLDLVIEVRPAGSSRLAWDIRCELPGSDVPTTPHGYADSLHAAIEVTTVAEAMTGLAERCHTAPAHYLAPSLKPDQLADEVNVDQLERRILRDCADAPGAQAIWRDRHWWHTGLQSGDQQVTLNGLDTGQLSCRVSTGYRRNWEPPSPAYLGEPIPVVPCPDCHATGTAPAGPDQPGKNGRRCPTCAGHRQLHQGAAVVLTDLADQTISLNWRPDDNQASANTASANTASGNNVSDEPDYPLVAIEPTGQPVVQLRTRFRLGSWVGLFGRGPEALTEFDSGQVVDHELCHGLVTLPHPDADPVGRYLALAARGRPGARLQVFVTGWPGPSLGQLARVVHGLGLALRVTAQDLARNADDLRKVQGMRWQVSIVDPEDTTEPVTPPLRQSLPEAVDYCLRYLGPALRATIPGDPARPIRVPQQPVPTAELLESESSLRQHARDHPGEPVTISLHHRS